MSWFYPDSAPDRDTDEAEGIRTLVRDVPEYALFDGDYEYRGRGPQQRPKRYRG